MKKGKKYLEVAKKVDKHNLYTKEEAIKLVKDTNPAKFDASVEIAIKLNVDPRKADQQLRGAAVLPNGTGKSKKILVIAKGNAAKEAKAAGADYVGDNDMIEKIQKENWFDFDIILATPEMMPALGKIGRILGPKKLMPNPKTGTVTLDTKKAVEEIQKGRVEYNTDSFGNIHTIIGKVSFTQKQLVENLSYFVTLILRNKPATVKGTFIQNISISSTMGPGIKVDIKNFDK